MLLVSRCSGVSPCTEARKTSLVPTGTQKWGGAFSGASPKSQVCPRVVRSAGPSSNLLVLAAPLHLQSSPVLSRYGPEPPPSNFEGPHPCPSAVLRSPVARRTFYTRLVRGVPLMKCKLHSCSAACARRAAHEATAPCLARRPSIQYHPQLPREPLLSRVPGPLGSSDALIPMNSLALGALGSSKSTPCLCLLSAALDCRAQSPAL